MPNPDLNPKLAVDLSDRHAQAEAAAKAAEDADERRKMAYARAWDKLMQRAFKGIMPRPQRHAGMRRAAARMAKHGRAVPYNYDGRELPEVEA